MSYRQSRNHSPTPTQEKNLKSTKQVWYQVKLEIEIENDRILTIQLYHINIMVGVIPIYQ